MELNSTILRVMQKTNKHGFKRLNKKMVLNFF